uniref:General transcription factor IIF subunit 2 n=1 Tax=Saimiri boliviensis boliviensis TaxID=39432 RepID=A0A2K6TB63_SAIBB
TVKHEELDLTKSSKPLKLSQQLDKVVATNYKPVQHVLDMLFSAFEKHQYCNLKDLVDITKQPVGCVCHHAWLILKEIGVQNVKGIHKSTWELKPEYRHYQGEEKND